MFQEGCAIIFLNWLVLHVRCHGGPFTGFCRSVIAYLYLCTVWTSVWWKRCMLIHDFYMMFALLITHKPEFYFWSGSVSKINLRNVLQAYRFSEGFTLLSFTSHLWALSPLHSIQPFCMLLEMQIIVIWHFCFNIWLSKCKGEWV